MKRFITIAIALMLGFLTLTHSVAAQAHLIAASITFYTPGYGLVGSLHDDKDKDTRIEIAIYDVNTVWRFYISPAANPNPTLVYYSDDTGQGNGSNNTINLMPTYNHPVGSSNVTTEADWGHINLNLRILPVGNEKWVFVPSVTLKFDDGHSQIYEPAPGQRVQTFDNGTGLRQILLYPFNPPVSK